MPVEEARKAREVSNDSDSESFFLSVDHVAALAGTAMLCMALSTLARTRPGAWTGRLSRGLAVALLASFIAYHPVPWLQARHSRRLSVQGEAAI